MDKLEYARWYNKNVWYPKNRDAHRARVSARRARLTAICVELIRAAKNRPCKDCDQKHPHYVMEFDHLRDKVFNLAQFRLHTLDPVRVQEEMDKCEVVCANCHATRTWERAHVTQLDREPDYESG